MLASVADGKVTLIAGVTADLHRKVKAGELVNHVAQQVGGKGGGRPDMAQAGGTDPAALPAALSSRSSELGGAALCEWPRATRFTPQFAERQQRRHLPRGARRARRRRTRATRRLRRRRLDARARPKRSSACSTPTPRSIWCSTARQRIRSRSPRSVAAPMPSSATRIRMSTSTSATRRGSSAAAPNCSPSDTPLAKITPHRDAGGRRDAARRARVAAARAHGNPGDRVGTRLHPKSCRRYATPRMRAG